jgi:hypothetical protein
MYIYYTTSKITISKSEDPNNLYLKKLARTSSSLRTVLLSLFALIGFLILVFAILSALVNVQLAKIVASVFMAALVTATVGAITLLGVVSYLILNEKKHSISDKSPSIVKERQLNNQQHSVNPDVSTMDSRSNNSNIANIHFLIYQNTIFGMKMQYPSGWEVHENNNSSLNNEDFTQIASFLSPMKTNSESLGKLEEMLIIYVKNMPFPNLSLDEYARNHIAHLKSTFLKSMKFTLIDFRPTALTKGSIGQTIIYKVRPVDESEIKTTEVLTMKGNNIYLIKFTSRSSKYSEYLPVLQKMVDSFE